MPSYVLLPKIDRTSSNSFELKISQQRIYLGIIKKYKREKFMLKSTWMVQCELCNNTTTATLFGSDSGDLSCCSPLRLAHVLVDSPSFQHLKWMPVQGKKRQLQREWDRKQPVTANPFIAVEVFKRIDRRRFVKLKNLHPTKSNRTTLEEIIQAKIGNFSTCDRDNIENKIWLRKGQRRKLNGIHSPWRRPVAPHQLLWEITEVSGKLLLFQLP